MVQKRPEKSCSFTPLKDNARTGLHRCILVVSAWWETENRRISGGQELEDYLDNKEKLDFKHCILGRRVKYVLMREY